jgi:hypothetical protein
VDALGGGALDVGGGEGGAEGREETWCLVRIHSGPKCKVLVVISRCSLEGLRKVVDMCNLD